MVGTPSAGRLADFHYACYLSDLGAAVGGGRERVDTGRRRYGMSEPFTQEPRGIVVASEIGLAIRSFQKGTNYGLRLALVLPNPEVYGPRGASRPRT